LVTIPPGIINGYKTIGDQTAMVANCSDLAHEPNEMIRHDPSSDIVPYKWDLIHK
jgi:dTDP-4-dehydrorhamnose 3,5-epimerase